MPYKIGGTMAHIVELSVGGLAGRRKVYTQKLNRTVNVFFGLNGSGKTSLLRILNSAMEDDATGLEWVPFDWAEITIHTIMYDRDFVARIEKPTVPKRKAHELRPTRRRDIAMASIVRFEDVPRELKWKTKGLPRRATRGWAHRYLPTWRLYFGDEVYQSPLELERTMSPALEFYWDRIFAKRLEVIWGRYSNELLSKVRQIQEQGLTSILQSILTAKTKPQKSKRYPGAQTAYERVAAFLERQKSLEALGSFRSFSKKYTEDPQLRKVVSYINRIEQRIERAVASREQLKCLIDDMFTGEKGVKFKDTGIMVEMADGESISLASLSSGEKHVLSIFIETLLAAENTLLIDEPEMSLHIDWQKSLIPSMHRLNPEAQLILTTHSPEVMSGLPDKEIFAL